MSDLFKLAQKRNWSKYRLMGITFPKEGLTDEELMEIEDIKKSLRELFEKWDDRSRSLNLVPKEKKLL